jgi:hypothetical protein
MRAASADISANTVIAYGFSRDTVMVVEPSEGASSAARHRGLRVGDAGCKRLRPVTWREESARAGFPDRKEQPGCRDG